MLVSRPLSPKQNTEMIRKFALLATTAALLVACGGATEENMEAKAKASADSAKAAMEKIEADAKAAQAKADSIANAMPPDTTKMEAAPAGH
jgi:hypothetical protein